MTLRPRPDAFVIRGRRVVTERGIAPAAVHAAGGRILRVAEWSDVGTDVPIDDVGDALLMPGVIDTHVHVNDPGRSEWEGFDTATRAAAAGGVTTILDMPLNSIPATTTVAALERKRDAARDRAVANVEYIGGVVPGNAREIEPLAAAGVRAFKCFLTPSGVDEFLNVAESDLREVLPALARTGLPLMVHAEDPALIGTTPLGGSTVYADYLTSRPPWAERSAIELMVRLIEWCPTPVHIVHLSAASSLDTIDAARARGLPITVETCPHYLTFAAEDIDDGATQFKCAPPIRNAAQREALWQALVDGRIDLIASDHSPCPPSMKNLGGDFFSAWGGIASLQLSLAAVWTGARARGLGVEHVIRWMCTNTARLAGLSHDRGRIAAGARADLVVWDPDASFVVDPSRLAHRHHITPYAERELFGVVRATYVNGILRHPDTLSSSRA